MASRASATLAMQQILTRGLLVGSMRSLLAAALFCPPDYTAEAIPGGKAAEQWRGLLSSLGARGARSSSLAARRKPDTGCQESSAMLQRDGKRSAHHTGGDADDTSASEP